jgi:cysteine synthase
MFIANDVTEVIGKTPLLKLTRLFPDCPANILAKLEVCNPTSIKDRAVLNMVNKAIERGDIKLADGDSPGTEVVEATSGNTGIAIAALGAMLGFRGRLYMTDAASIERQKLICAYGSTVVLTPAAEFTKGARERGMKYCEDNPGDTFFLNQHSNPDNAGAHITTTGPEIWRQTGGDIGAVVIGLGTSGTFEGLSSYFKSQDETISMVGVEPALSPVYSGGKPGVHKIGGIGPGMVTDNFERARKNVDEILLVKDEVAYDWARLVTRKEGLIAGPTSGATLWGASELAKRPEFAGKTIICFLYDTGERYLSVKDLFEADNIIHVK